MRRIADFVSFVLLGLLLLVTSLAVFGPTQLPLKVATHLNDLGLADAWTERSSYEIVPMIAVIMYLAFTIFAAFSTLAKHAAQANSENAPRLEPLILKLVVWIKLELMAVFLCMQLSSLHAARHLDDPTSIWSFGQWSLFVGIFATVAWFIRTLFRMEPSGEGHGQQHAIS